MNLRLSVVLAALALAALACNLPNIDLPRLKTIPTETLEISEPLPDSAEVVDVSIRMGAGKLDLSGGAEQLLEGRVQYNIAEWKPEVTRSGSSLTVAQSSSTGSNFGLPESGQEIVNDWQLKLGEAPMNLDIWAGAYEGVVDLSGVPLRRLRISDGASRAEVVFDAVNPEEMTRLSYQTGASTVTLTGLANANFAAMDFAGGAGSYTLDFSGELQRDADVTIEAGASTLRLVMPEGTRAKVVVDGALSDVSNLGGWEKTGNTYTSAGEGPVLTIHVNIGVGSLTLVNK